MNMAKRWATVAMTVAMADPLCALAADAAPVDTAPYRARAPLAQYLMADEGDEVALARSAAPSSLSDASTVMVLGTRGYRTVVRGRNGFVCMVWRSWSDDLGDPQFWNPRVRAPICMNPVSVRTVLPDYLQRTDWVVAGLSRTEIASRTATNVRTQRRPAPGRCRT